jgi:lipopolysaccharide/colanic/teichoic acid biosynthesis glycosyltransferase
MHTVDTSPNQPVHGAQVSSLNRCVYSDPVPQGDARGSAPLLSDKAAFDRIVSACQNYAEIPAGNEIAAAASGEIPTWKRLLDVTCILISLPFWLPVVMVVALWIKIVSPGPIFFRQERVGYHGRRFMILKFRTMKVNVETQSHERHLEQLIGANCPMTKLDAGDPRIIPGGRILRAMGLDELPQLFIVLRGEMSLVGPRPCTPHEFKRYVVWQRERVNAPPGLTGYWQVNGKNKTTFTEMITMDIHYTKNMSLWLDLVIMLKTLPAVIAQVLEARIENRAGEGAAKSGEEFSFKSSGGSIAPPHSESGSVS